jgi:hypothetical protein
MPHEETFKFNQQDYWFGRSFWLFDGKSERSRSTRLITLLRFLNRKYTERPEYQFDSLRYYSSEKFYFASIGLSSRKYTQERFLFKFNVTEDVPSGFVYNLIGGYQQKNNINRYYLGGQFSIGRYYDFGYLGGKIELGSFFHRKITEQTGFVGTITYFTPLIETGGWKFRQFVKPILVLGNNRLEASYDQLNLNGMNGIQGFSTTPDSGTKKATLNLQTQGYSPWNVYGFRINPYLSYTLGMLGNKEHGFCNSKVYSQYGLGFIISNDFFVFNSFQVSFSYYPTIPGFADDVIKTNSFKTSDFGLPNFEITKPSIVPYQ